MENKIQSINDKIFNEITESLIQKKIKQERDHLEHFIQHNKKKELPPQRLQSIYSLEGKSFSLQKSSEQSKDSKSIKPPRKRMLSNKAMINI